MLTDGSERRNRWRDEGLDQLEQGFISLHEDLTRPDLSAEDREIRRRRNSPPIVTVIGITGIPLVHPGDHLASIIVDAARRQKTPIAEGDAVVVTHTVVSLSEGLIVDLEGIEPSDFAKRFGVEHGKDPRLVELVLRNSKRIVRMKGGILIAETKHGFVCANAGVDVSNVSGGSMAVTLPQDPDASANRIRRGIKDITGLDVALLVSDTHGRPLRRGQVNLAIGVSGINPLYDRRGEFDLHGRALQVKTIAVADEICGAAELVIGQAAEGIPAAIVRGYRYHRGRSSARQLIRKEEEDLFI